MITCQYNGHLNEVQCDGWAEFKPFITKLEKECIIFRKIVPILFEKMEWKKADTKELLILD